MPALIGYARVSTDDQNLQLQYDALASVVQSRPPGSVAVNTEVNKVFSDKASAASSNRPGLAAALSHLRPGDTLVVWKLDRLGRSMRSLVELMEQLKERGVHFRSLTESIDTSTPMGTFFFHMMAGLAQMERELTVERTKAGIAAARARGRHGGRRRALSDNQIQKAKKYFRANLGATEIAAMLGVSVPTIYRAVPAIDRQIEAFPD